MGIVCVCVCRCDRYLLLASDGLFAFMSDTECMDILHAAATTHNMCPRQAARHLIKEARKRSVCVRMGSVPSRMQPSAHHACMLRG